MTERYLAEVRAWSKARPTTKQRLRRAYLTAKRMLRTQLSRRGLTFSWNDPEVSTVRIADFPFAPVRDGDAAVWANVHVDVRTISIWVNGVRYDAARIARQHGRSLFLFPAESLESGENVIALSGKSGPGSGRLLLPWQPTGAPASETPYAARVFHVADARVSRRGTYRFEGRVAEYASTECDSLARDHLRRSIKAGTGRFHGLAPGCFDLESNTWRLKSWIWTNGALVEALLTTSKHEDDAMCRKVGDRLLEFQVIEGANRGAFPVRWDITSGSPAGFTEWLAPNDAAFLGSYGFMSLYQRFKEERFLSAAVRIGQWILREGLEVDGRLRVGFRVEQNRWVRDWLYVDAGFVTRLFRDLFRETGDALWKDASDRFLGWYIDRFFQRAGGYFAVSVVNDCSHAVKRQFSRGQAWALDGLISGWEIGGDSSYLEVAERVGRQLERTQLRSGGWAYMLDRPSTGVCNKGTTVIGYQLSRLGRILGSETLVDSARRAAAWFEAHQLRQWQPGDPVGGAPGWNDEGAITGRLASPTVFPYATAFFILLKSHLERQDEPKEKTFGERLRSEHR